MKQQIKTFFVSGLLALALFGAAQAGPLENANAADERGDFATELQILRPLAEQGNAFAQSAIGMMYQQGLGVARDYTQALILLRKAADQGNAFGQMFLSDMYRDGQGVPQDYVRAHMWYNLAASRAPDAARAVAIKDRDDIAAKMTPAQIADAQRMASEWVPKK